MEFPPREILHRCLAITRRPDGKIGVIWKGKEEVKGWVIDKPEDVSQLLTKATEKGAFPAVYPLDFLGIVYWCLEQSQLDKFIKLAKPFEIKLEEVI